MENMRKILKKLKINKKERYKKEMTNQDTKGDFFKH